MSIYSEHELGYIDDAEFRSLAAYEEGRERPSWSPEDELVCAIDDALDTVCHRCERDDCDTCLVNVAMEAVYKAVGK